MRSELAGIWTAARIAYMQNAVEKRAVSKRTLLLVGAVVLALSAMFPDLAMAEPWDTVADRIVDIFTGGLARTLGVIAVISCGVLALIGRMSWQWAFYIIIGLTMIFGAFTIVDFFIDAAGG